MSGQECIEQLESRKLLDKGLLLQEVSDRTHKTLSSVMESGFEDAHKAILSLRQCGYSYFEALYFICGAEIQFCGLLSKKSQNLVKTMHTEYLRDVEREREDSTASKLVNIKRRLDEHILREALREDSKRFKKIMERVVE